LNSTMCKLPKRPTKNSMVDTWTVDKSDLTAPPKEKDLLEDSEETEVDSVEETEEDSVEDSETITLETPETQPLFLVRTIRTPRRVPLALSKERKSPFDDVLRTYLLFKFHTNIKLNLISDRTFQIYFDIKIKV
jgi:hypothetical protein